MPDEEIEKFLLNYLEYSGDKTTTIGKITTEFNIHTTYIAFSKFAMSRKDPGDIEVGDRLDVLSTSSQTN